MSADASPVARIRDAADLLASLDRDATDGPWVAVLDTTSPAVAVPVDECTCRAKGRDWPTHQPGCGHELVCYPDGKHARGDAVLIAALRPLAGSLAVVFREWAKVARLDPDLLHRCGGMETLAVADAVLTAAPREETKL